MAANEPDVSVFQSSVVKDPEAGYVPQSRMLDPSSYRDTTVPGYDENDFQSHRNVFVAVHVPYSQNKHNKHRHKKKHSTSSSSLHHGHNGRNRHGNGRSRQSEGNVSLQEEQGAEPDSISEPGGRVRFDKKTHTKFHKSLSLPNGKPAGHQGVNVPPVILEPCTPSDPCDRVKFILGEDEPDHPAHEPCTHTIFSELEELKYNENDTMEWKETARWVKFEEDVEEGGNKWSKPHVATLSLHSLFELRSCILKGTVLLDLHAENLAQIADYVLDQLVHTGELEEECREKVRTALLQRHKHLNSKKEGQERKIMEHIRSLGEIGRLNSNTSKHLDPELGGTPTSSVPGSRIPSRRNSFLHGNNNNGSSTTTDGMGNGILSSIRNGSLAGVEEERGNSDQDLANLRKHSHICKKLPPGSEASNVLVGEVDFLSHPIIAFVRLAQGQYLGDLTEVPIPTRFLFIMLGPKGNQERYHEIGRSIATLMSDEVFHDVAYKARNRGDLLAGVDEFLDKVTVLPPGEWDPKIRLEPPDTVPSQADRRTTIVPEKQKEIQERKKSLSTSNRAPPIKWSKKPFGGFIDDILKCYFAYRSDFRDAFSLQGLASLILIFFANLTLAFTFGAFLSDVTNGTLGTTEMILAVGIGNFIFSIFSGQPLVILGATGPTIIFEQILFDFCSSMDIPFLNFRFWIGMWTALFMVILVAFNTSAVMRLFTRFTEEIFTALVSFVFIYEAFAKLWNIHKNSPYNEWILYPTIRRSCDCYQFQTLDLYETNNKTNATRIGSYWDTPDCSNVALRKYVGDDCELALKTNYHDVFLMSVILFFGTFLLCLYLRKFRRSMYLRGFIRHIVSDFAVFISVLVWVVVDVLAQVDTPKPTIPNVFNTSVFTDENRTSLFIKPLGNDLPRWAPAAAIIPALLATILLFVDQHITALIVNRKDNKLKKGPGYHLDMLIVGFLIFLHSALGLPWVVGATVVSISHVQSLFLFSNHSAPGERPKFLGVREQRVTLFFMAILVALSVMAYPVLQLLPLPVLYGLLLYLGVASLNGIQFMKRVKLFFVPNKYKPDCKYFRHIPTHRIHAYTIIQIVFLLLLIVFQVVTELKVVFPLIVLTLVLGRYLLGFIFSKHDLELLDEPIPDKLYCKRFRERGKDERKCDHGLAEEGSAGTEEDSTDGGAENKDAESLEEVVTSEPVSEETMTTTYKARNPLFTNKSQSFNISQEVNKCDLWKNMMKKLDAPPPSPRKAAKYRSKSPSVLAARQVSESEVEEGDEPSFMRQQHPGFGTQESYDSVGSSKGSKPSACRQLYQSTSV